MQNPTNKPDFLLNKAAEKTIAAANDLPKNMADIGNQKLRLNVAQASASLNPSAAPTPEEPLPLEETTGAKWLRYSLVSVCVVWLCGWSAFALPSATQAAELGIAIAAGFSPVLMVVVWLSSLSRRREAALYAQALQTTLQGILLPGEARTKLVNNELSLLLDQAAEITRTTRTTLATLQDMREGVREELREFANLTRLAEGHLSTLSGEVQTKASSMQDMADDFKNVLIQLDATSVNAELKVSKLQQALSTGTDALQGVALTLDAKMSAIAQGTERMSEEVTRLDTMVKDQNTVLVSTVASMVEQVGSTTVALESGRHNLKLEVNALKQVEQQVSLALAQGTDRLAGVSDVVLNAGKHVFGGLDMRLMSLQEQFLLWSDLVKVQQANNEASTGLVVDVTTKLETLGGISDTTAVQVTKLVQLLTGALEQLKVTGAQSSEKVEEISAMSERLTEALRLSSLTLQERAAQAEDHIRTSLQSVQRVTNGLDEKQAALSDVLVKRTNDIQTATDKLAIVTETVRQDMRKGLQEMASVTGDIAARTTAISSQLSQHRVEVEEIVTIADGKLLDFTGTLEKAGSALRQVVSMQNDIVDQGTNNLEKATKALDQSSQAIQAALNAGEENCISVGHKMERAATNYKQVFVAQSDEIEKAADKMMPILKSTTADSETMVRQLHALSQVAKSALVQISSEFSATQVNLDERLTRLSSLGADTTQQLRVMSELTQGVVENLSNAASTAESKVRQLNVSMERQADTMHLMTDRYISKVENTQKLINEGFQDLSGAIGASVSSLEGAGQAFTVQMSQAENNADKVVQSLQKIGDKAKMETGQVLAQIGLLQTAMSKLVAQAASQQETLMEGSDKAQAAIKTSVLSIAQTFEDVQQTTADRLNALQTAISHVKLESKDVLNFADESIKSVDCALQDMLKNMSVVDGVIAKSQKIIEQATGQFIQQVTVLDGKSAAMVSNSQEIVHELGRSGIQLDTLLTRLQEDAENLRTQKMVQERDAFLSSSRFVFESLHTLSVDLVRGVEGDLPDKAWKAYERGDITALTQRLVSIIDRIPLDKIRDKVMNDSSFRTHTQRYTSLFEDLFDQALNSERGSLIAASLLTSDLGRIYGLLSDAMGRPQKRLDK